MQPVPITASPDKDLGARTLVLRYRAATSTAFTDVAMEKRPTGAFVAAIPAEASAGPQVVYFIEARRTDGAVMTRGSAADPIVVAPAEVTKPRPGRPRRGPKAVAAPSVYFAVLGGTGFGVTSGTGEETRNSVSSSGVAWARAVPSRAGDRLLHHPALHARRTGAAAGRDRRDRVPVPPNPKTRRMRR